MAYNPMTNHPTGPSPRW